MRRVIIYLYPQKNKSQTSTWWEERNPILLFTWTLTILKQEASTGGVLWKKVFLRKSTGKHLRRSLFFNSVARKKRLRRFHVNFAKFLKILFYRAPPDNCFWPLIILNVDDTFLGYLRYKTIICHKAALDV